MPDEDWNCWRQRESRQPYLKEAVGRGHEVTAIVRDAAKIQDKRVDVVEKNIFDIKSEDLQKYDVVVNAFGAAPGKEHQHVEAGRACSK